jgi:hypothetical protein
VSEASFPESTVSNYHPRFCSDDAAGVTQLVEGVYGDAYRVTSTALSRSFS